MRRLKRLTKFSLTAGAASAALTILLPLASAQAQQVSSNAITVESQDLGSALRMLARQTGTQVVFDPAIVNGRRAPKISNAQSPEHALRQMLADTGLTYRVTSRGTYTILANATETETARPTQLGAADGAASSVEEIVVTAQRRAEDLSDVPISIAAIPGTILDRSTARGTLDVLSTVAGVASAPTYAGNNVRLTVRGVSGDGALASPIAYYVDGVPFGFTRASFVPDSSAYDLDRIEVLRGPQGTLYGASALNGVVRILTHDAEPGSFDAKGAVTGSSTEGGDSGYRTDASMNIVLVPDILAVRLTGGYEEMGGWIDRPLEDNANDGERSNVRLRLRANLTDDLSLGLSAWSSRSEYGAPNSSADGETNAATLDESSAADFDTFGFNAGYDFGTFALDASTSFVNYRSTWNIDGTPVGLPALVQSDLDSEVLSQEVTLTSDESGEWLWSLGTLYREGEDRQTVLVPGFALNLSDFTDRSESYAVFGEVTRLLLDGALEVTGGLRYFHDEIEFVDYNVPTQNNSAGFEATTPRFVVTWHPHDKLSVYASYGEGFRSGLTQTGTIVTSHPEFAPADPDSLTNYELGVKGQLFSGRLQYDAALYFMDWQDVQQNVSVDVDGVLFPAVVNGSSASGPGFDFSARFEPVAQLELGFAFSWNDITMDEEVLSGPTVIFEEGARLNQAPEYTIGVSASYAFALGANGWSGQVSASSNYISELLTRSAGIVVSGDALNVARAEFSVQAPQNWRMALFADNLTNEGGVVLAQFGVPDWNSRLRPRTFGVKLEYRY